MIQISDIILDERFQWKRTGPFDVKYMELVIETLERPLICLFDPMD